MKDYRIWKAGYESGRAGESCSERCPYCPYSLGTQATEFYQWMGGFIQGENELREIRNSAEAEDELEARDREQEVASEDRQDQEVPGG